MLRKRLEGERVQEIDIGKAEIGIFENLLP